MAVGWSRQRALRVSGRLKEQILNMPDGCAEEMVLSIIEDIENMAAAGTS